jgi:trehalose 6-phosphate synthase
MNAPPLVIASNRGPVTFSRMPNGGLSTRRGVGGLVTALADAVIGRDVRWIAAPMSSGDRQVLRATGGVAPVGEDMPIDRFRFVDVAWDEYRRYYREFSNRILWFLHHGIGSGAWDRLGGREVNAWISYMDVNRRFAEVMAEEVADGTPTFPQDYQLGLVPAGLRGLRPDARICQYWHIPFATPSEYRRLPEAWGRPLLEGLLAADVIALQTNRWATNFLACCRDVLGASVQLRGDGWTVDHRGGTTSVVVLPIGVSPSSLEDRASRQDVASEHADLDAWLDGRRLILRVDRTDPSKNVVRGLQAYERLLERRADLRGRVVHLAILVPSRLDIEEYQQELDATMERADRINERFATADWEPVRVEVGENLPRAFAAYRRYDALLVNPVRDGMNLVAREGPILNRRAGALVLSANAGAAAELSPAALVVDPFDVEETAAALERAVSMPVIERWRRSRWLRRLARGLEPRTWIQAQLEALDDAAGLPRSKDRPVVDLARMEAEAESQLATAT